MSPVKFTNLFDKLKNLDSEEMEEVLLEYAALLKLFQNDLGSELLEEIIEKNKDELTIIANQLRMKL